MIFLRHPKTDAPDGMCYGRSDVGWGAGAEAEVSAAIDRLPQVRALWASPLRRCQLLAERCGRAMKLQPVFDARLMEYDFGEWEGQFWTDIPRAESEPWTANIQYAAPPGGERFTDLIARVRAVLAEIPNDSLVVTHAGPIRAARMILTGASFDEVFRWKVPYCQPLSLEQVAA